MGTGAEGDIAAVEPGELGNPQPGLGAEEDQRPVPPSLPGGQVGRGEERVAISDTTICRADRLFARLNGLLT
jgi:hypothetical protein